MRLHVLLQIHSAGEQPLPQFLQVGDWSSAAIILNGAPGAFKINEDLTGPRHDGQPVKDKLGKQAFSESAIGLLDPPGNRAVDDSHADGFVGKFNCRHVLP
jgi:hypothetical protein